MSAAREGAATMLIERFGCFGGMIDNWLASSQLPWWRQRKYGRVRWTGTRNRRNGKSMGASSPDLSPNSQAINAERFKLVADAVA